MKKIIKRFFSKEDVIKEELTPKELIIRDKIEKEFYFKAAWGIISTAVFLVILFAIIFFINIEGQEDTKVPNLEGLKLPQAIIMLQERALYPKLSVKNTAPNEKGLIISQDISAGTVVKAGRLIGITASLGGVIDSVGSYEGQTLKAVQAELQKLFSGTSSEPVLVIGPSIGLVSDEPEGTILSQNPAPGTEITEVTEIIFHISKGKQESTYVVPTMKGLEFQVALKKITQWPIRYRFTVRNKKDDEKAGYIVSQTPERGNPVSWTTILEMVMTTPEEYPSNYTFGLIEIVVPTYPISMPMELERVKTDGSREFIFSSKTFGGALTIPYLEEVGTRLVITVADIELQSFIVRQQ
ncbi:MAG: PASTA domain-containing protein [Spirochaetaceae bacterium]